MAVPVIGGKDKSSSVFKTIESADKTRHNPPELTVVVPTLNESENIGPLLSGLESTLDGIAWEAVIVDDDSPDQTAAFARKIACGDTRVRVIRRVGRRGLSSACIEGVLSSSSPYFAVVDADLQHDMRILPDMLQRLKSDNLDVVIGSRYAEGGSVGDWSNPRRFISWAGGRAARLVTKADLKDPMSGFFVMRRDAFDELVYRLSQRGFKILLDIFASAERQLRHAEIPYTFGVRMRGQSKLDGMAVWSYGILVAEKLFGWIVPVRFILFAIVGGSGLVIHVATLALALAVQQSFAIAQTFAVFLAMTWNFALNNLVTYRDKKLRGWRFVGGLISFYLICSVGAVANVGVATFVYRQEPIWWAAGIAGALMGLVWNYSVSGFFTWNNR